MMNYAEFSKNNSKSEVLYTCVLLNNKSHEYLKKLIPNDLKNWKIYAHHSTIKLGNSPEELIDKLGQNVTLDITDIGYNDKVCAVKVKINDDIISNLLGKYKSPKFYHVTLCVNIENGGKPAMSNDIIEWKPIKGEQLIGTITEIKK